MGRDVQLSHSPRSRAQVARRKFEGLTARLAQHGAEGLGFAASQHRLHSAGRKVQLSQYWIIGKGLQF